MSGPLRRHYYQDMTQTHRPKPNYPHCGCCEAKVIAPRGEMGNGVVFTCECPLIKMEANGTCIRCGRCRLHCSC